MGLDFQEEQEDFQGQEGREEEGVSGTSKKKKTLKLLSDLFLFSHLFRFLSSFLCYLYFTDIQNIKQQLYRADPFAKKDWYDIKAPSLFNQRQVGKTLVTRTQGTKASLSLSLLYAFLFSRW